MKDKPFLIKSLRYDLILPGLILIFVGTLFMMALFYPWKSAQLPLIIGGITLALLFIEFYLKLFATTRKAKKKKTEVDLKVEKLKQSLETAVEEDPRVVNRRLLAVLLSILFYLLALNLLGFLIASLILSVALIRLLGYRRLWVNLTFSVVFVGGLFAIFSHFLGVSLPWGIILGRFFE